MKSMLIYLSASHYNLWEACGVFEFDNIIFLTGLILPLQEFPRQGLLLLVQLRFLILMNGYLQNQLYILNAKVGTRQFCPMWRKNTPYTLSKVKSRGRFVFLHDALRFLYNLVQWRHVRKFCLYYYCNYHHHHHYHHHFVVFFFFFLLLCLRKLNKASNTRKDKTLTAYYAFQSVFWNSVL